MHAVCQRPPSKRCDRERPHQHHWLGRATCCICIQLPLPSPHEPTCLLLQTKGMLYLDHASQASFHRRVLHLWRAAGSVNVTETHMLSMESPVLDFRYSLYLPPNCHRFFRQVCGHSQASLCISCTVATYQNLFYVRSRRQGLN